MDQTFMTIHNLTPNANILFASDSITDILGYHPRDVQDKSCFDYFHPDEVPFARHIHNRGVLLDKAAVLHYARIRARDGGWVSCECCFTVVHDVLVACISIYRRDEKSERRAIEAPQIRRIFSCSPRDPRYHMLEHLSPKFRMPAMEREPRAALIVNRFTRSLGIMFATDAIGAILGLDPEQIQDKSFYECIQESCLEDAVKCMESAKANDSIAYLRFWSRDPRRPEDLEQDDDEEDYTPEEEEEEEREEFIDSKEEDMDEEMCWTGPQDEEEDGGAPLIDDADMEPSHEKAFPPQGQEDAIMADGDLLTGGSYSPASRTASATSLAATGSTATHPTTLSASSSSTGAARRDHPLNDRSRPPRYPVPSVELEAVVSCTSDGLVVVLRRARPQIPMLHHRLLSPSHHGHGLFAAPWGRRPIRPPPPHEPDNTFRPALLPRYMPRLDHGKAAGGPPQDQLMKSIREVAVFAWGLVGINGTLANHSHGRPIGEAQPPGGLPVWDPHAGPMQYQGPENSAAERWARYDDQGGSFGSRDLGGQHYRTSYPEEASVTDFASESPQWRHGHAAPGMISAATGSTPWTRAYAQPRYSYGNQSWTDGRISRQN